MNGRSPGKTSPRLGNGLRDDGRLRHAEPRTAIFFGHGNAEPAAARDIGHKVVGEATLAVALQPIGIVIFRADPSDRVMDGLLFIA